MHWGGMLQSSDDFGKTWTNPEEANVKFPEGTGAALKQIWQIAPGREAEPDTLYCGVEPAALFVSRDAGDTWSLVDGLWNHPQRPRWQPGGGGLCLHTILLDPERLDRMRVAISTGGVYATDDGGTTWRPSNKGVRADFLPDKYPEFGQCVHKVVQSKRKPERMFLQNHWGLYRSDDRGESWTDIANGVPSDFGFPMAIHPANPDCAWIVPLESDQFRCTPEGKLRVYRTRDAGASLGARCRTACRRTARTRPCCATRSRSTRWQRRASTSARAAASCSARRTKARAGPTLADGLPPVISVKAAVV